MGAMYGARRSLREDSYYWRITQFVMPFYGMFPAGQDGTVPLHIWVPIDDSNTLSWGLDWQPVHPFAPEELDESNPRFSFGTGGGAEYLPATSRAHGAWYTVANSGNDYLLDRDMQRTKTFSGIPTIALQDTAVTESMGSIYQRDKEPGANDPEMFRLRSCAVHLPRHVDWLEATADWLEARTTEMPAERIEVQMAR
jgi:hypothetical protein